MDAPGARLAASSMGENNMTDDKALDAVLAERWEVATARTYKDGKPETTEYFVRRVIDGNSDDVAIASDIIDPDGPPYVNDNAELRARVIVAGHALIPAATRLADECENLLGFMPAPIREALEDVLAVVNGLRETARD